MDRFRFLEEGAAIHFNSSTFGLGTPKLTNSPHSPCLPSAPWQAALLPSVAAQSKCHPKAVCQSLGGRLMVTPWVCSFPFKNEPVPYWIVEEVSV